MNLVNESGDSMINLVSPMDRLTFDSTPRSNTSMDSGSVTMMDSSFDAVVRESINSQPSNPTKNVPNKAHLDDHISVSNVLDGVNLSHLSPIFEREEVLFY